MVSGLVTSFPAQFAKVQIAGGGPRFALPGGVRLPSFALRHFIRRKRQAAIEPPATVRVLPRQTIAVVGSPEFRPPLEDIVGPGAYNVMFIESIEGAHSRIVQTRPDRVILCCDVDDPSGFHLLSMLKADCRTRTIPAITYVTWPAAQAFELMSQ
jgi:CheY-like chemotaxis protein